MRHRIVLACREDRHLAHGQRAMGLKRGSICAISPVAKAALRLPSTSMSPSK